MSLNFKKSLLKKETYEPKENINKHKHNYCQKHLLIVTNVNKHASANLFNSKEYYYVLKCDKCDSFIPDSVVGNYNHNIIENEKIDFSLPIINANTFQKCPHYIFSELTDVVVNSNKSSK